MDFRPLDYQFSLTILFNVWILGVFIITYSWEVFTCFQNGRWSHHKLGHLPSALPWVWERVRGACGRFGDLACEELLSVVTSLMSNTCTLTRAMQRTRLDFKVELETATQSIAIEYCALKTDAVTITTVTACILLLCRHSPYIYLI